MSYSTIYGTITGRVLADGVRSGYATSVMARRIAGEEGRSVIVEDRGTGECYRVTPAGHVWRPPKWWTPWDDELDIPLTRR